MMIFIQVNALTHTLGRALLFFFFFHVESATHLETIKQSYADTINDLNQELLTIREESQQSKREFLERKEIVE